MSNWQPIETAPKDGTAIWVLLGGQPFIGYYDPDRLRKAGEWFVKASFRRRVREGGLPDDIYGTYRFGVEPTHWLPLPDPPESAP